MKWMELNTERAPEKGQLLAYIRREKLIFLPYEDLGEVDKLLSGKELLEVHLFDRIKEYRAITSRSRRFMRKESEAEQDPAESARQNSVGIIEYLADFPDDEDTVYKETIRLEKGQGTITVLNHITYNESGMAAVDDFRLCM